MKLNLFHGSEEEIADFNLEKSKKWGKFGIWFSDSEEFAEMFGNYIKRVNITINNPKIISPEQWDDIRGIHAKDDQWFINWKHQLISKGHDSLLVKGGPMKFGNTTVTNPTIVAVFSTNQIEQLSEIYKKQIKQMNKIKITEEQYSKLREQLIKEEMSAFDDKEGNVVLDKKTNPNDIKKLTDKGLNVSLIDEKLSEEQPITYKHKFEGKKLNVYVTKEKSKIEDIMEYVYSIKDKEKVDKVFEGDNAYLFVKEAASGRYKDMGKLTKKYYKNVSGFRNFPDQTNASKEDNTLIVEPDGSGSGEGGE